MACVPYSRDVKMTLHIDEALLARVMEATGAATKTSAIDMALRELDRRATLVRLCEEGLGMDAAALKETVASDYHVETLRQSEMPVNYGRKTHSRG